MRVFDIIFDTSFSIVHYMLYFICVGGMGRKYNAVLILVRPTSYFVLNSMRPIILIDFLQTSLQQLYAEIDVSCMRHLDYLVQMTGRNRNGPGNSALFPHALYPGGIGTPCRKNLGLPSNAFGIGSLLHKIHHAIITDGHPVHDLNGGAFA